MASNHNNNVSNKIVKAENQLLIDYVFSIRTDVFVHEQKCLPSEEFDALDEVAHHYLLFENEIPVATGRFRKTEKGIKLERIATLKTFRGKGYATQLLIHLMNEASLIFPGTGYFYLHAQISVLPLYENLGFEIYGNTFIEADIVHQAMGKTTIN